MLEWIKLESSILLDSRIQELLDDHGFCGLGIYVAMRTAIESISENGLPLPQVLTVGAPRTRRNKMQRIICNYGLFHISDIGLVTCAPLTPAHTPAHVPAFIPKLTSEHKQNDDRKEEKQTIVRFRKPTVSEIADYCISRHNGIDPQRFYDYQEARGWMIGRSKMKDWKAAVRTWERNRTEPSTFVPDEDTNPSTQSAITQQDGITFFNGRPLPPSAPPRPSATAEWDDASESWFELYR